MTRVRGIGLQARQGVEAVLSRMAPVTRIGSQIRGVWPALGRLRSPRLRRRGGLALAGLGVGGAVWLAASVLSGLPDATALRGTGAMAQATVAFDRYDRPAFTIFREQRIEVPLEGVSPHLVRAIVAVEDQRFFDHRGVDPVRIAGAAWTNLRHGRAAQGASTLTQQLARQVFLTSEKTVQRKLREAVVAVRLERLFTKTQILEMYLNKVYFGGGLYGVEAASLGFFGKHAADLDVPEAALLAGLVKAPSAYAPTADLDRATARRNLVLQIMRDTGVIDGAAYTAGVASGVDLVDSLLPAEDSGRYYREEVRKELVERFGVERVYQGGLRVYTTLDPRMQQAAEREVARALAAIERRQGRKQTAGADDALQAALVALDPATGEVRAMVGGRDFSSSAFNRATQARRQPGSAFKPFVYAAALERGYSAATVIGGLNQPVGTAGGEWMPNEAHGEGDDEVDAMSVRSALRLSSNRAAVQTLGTVGIPAVLQYARRLGIDAQPSVPSLALGSGEVTLLAMARAFAAFANGGVVTTPTLLRRVESADGTLLYEAMPEEARALDTSTAFILTNMLADVVDRGTGRQVREAGFTRPAAGKTGTTNDYRDAWFVGYTPHLAAGVWIGFDRPRTIVGNGYAGQLAAPLWGRFMASATKDDPPTGFAMPDVVVPVEICRVSGQPAHEACGRAEASYVEFFARGAEPVGRCTVHRGWSLLNLFARGEASVSPTAPPALPPLVAATPEAAHEPALIESLPETPTADQRESEPTRAKRGFWSRLLGRRDSN